MTAAACSSAKNQGNISGNSLNTESPVMRLLWVTRKTFLIAGWLLRDWLGSRKIHLHFSASPWERDIRRFMGLTKHKVTFGRFEGREARQADMVIPLGLKDVAYMADNAGEFPRNQIPPPRKSAVELMHDKVRFSQWLSTSRFKAMSLRNVSNPPLFLKPRKGAWGDDCIAILDQESAEKHAALINSPDYLKTEILYSKFEYATHLVFGNGQILASLCIIYEFATETGVKGTDTLVSKKVTHDPFLNQWQELLRDFDYSGICCVNYKIIDKIPRLMEINPRFGGSLAEYFFSFIYPLLRSAKSSKVSAIA
jgi:hypothetical protein